MRLKGYDIAKVAKLFSGGGHIQAAGASVEGDFKRKVADIIKQIKIMN